MAKSRMIRIPRELFLELQTIKKAEKISRNVDGFRKIADYARIGKEIAQKDLLNANVLWFNTQNRKRRKKK